MTEYDDLKVNCFKCGWEMTDDYLRALSVKDISGPKSKKLYCPSCSERMIEYEDYTYRRVADFTPDFDSGDDP